MAKKAYKDRDLKFETLQLTCRTGNMQTRLQMQEQYLFIRHHHLYFTIHSMRLTVLR